MALKSISKEAMLSELERLKQHYQASEEQQLASGKLDQDSGQPPERGRATKSPKVDGQRLAKLRADSKALPKGIRGKASTFSKQEAAHILGMYDAYYRGVLSLKEADLFLRDWTNPRRDYRALYAFPNDETYLTIVYDEGDVVFGLMAKSALGKVDFNKSSIDPDGVMDEGLAAFEFWSAGRIINLPLNPILARVEALFADE